MQHASEMRNAHKILIRKPAGKRLLGGLKCSWEGIRMELREIRVRYGQESSDLGQELVVGYYEHGNENLDSIKDGKLL
jgi:hypothetical protein